MTPTDPARAAYRILVVDDNPAIHNDLRKILSEDSSDDPQLLASEAVLFEESAIHGAAFEIASAYQGQQGLALLEKAIQDGRSFAMAFVDIRMPPGWDGIETIRHLWQVDPNLQVVICTAYSDHSWSDIARMLGQSDSLVILKKPFDNIEIIQLANAMTNKWTASHQARIQHRELERMVHDATAELTYCATHDIVTDLPNRRLFDELLKQAIAVARRSGDMAAVLYIDLDGFKNVNDTMGHAAGDQLLRQVATRLRNQLRQCDTLARMGGDEFTLVAGGLTDPEAVEMVATRLQAAFEDEFQIEGNALSISASMGVSLYPRDGLESSALLRYADAAMYEAKRCGKNRTEFYTPELGAAVGARMDLESRLKSAVRNGELVLHYQPQFNMKTQTLVRYEALLRWTNPKLGVIPPGRFIPIAEETGLIASIGNWVIQQACSAAKKWGNNGNPRVPVGINVSSRQFSRADFVDSVLSTIDRISLDPTMLELEITESLIVQNSDDAVAKIGRLRERGIKISIDDFGTGYSSLCYLQKLPVDAIKIDQSFIRFLESDQKAESLVRGMVFMAHSLGLRVVAEGVETAGQFQRLCDCGADEVQGFLLGSPQPNAVDSSEFAIAPLILNEMALQSN